MKAVKRGKFKALSAFIKKLENSYTSNIIAYLKALEHKEEYTAENSQAQRENQPNRNKENDTKDQQNQNLVH